jgi:broad specificity phosphatase PhoE
MVGAPGGESPYDVSARAVTAIDDLRARYDSGNILIVSHKTVLRLVFCRLLNIELRRYREYVDWPACALTVLELGPCHAVARLVTDERHLFPQPRRNLVREQLPGWGEPDPGLIDGDPAGGGGALEIDLTADHGVDAMTGAVVSAIDPASGS